MNVFTKISAVSALVVASTVLASTSAAALTVEQSQELTNSAKTSITCNGECSGSAEVTQNAKQSQKIEMSPTAKHYKYVAPKYKSVKNKNLKAVYVPSAVVIMNDGQVRLNWGMRGGTCHVRYTESNMNVWKYNTSAGCDEGGVTINGLQSGVSYKFQVRQDNGAWSRVMVGKAQ